MQYIQYERLKRVINRKKFLKDSGQGMGAASTSRPSPRQSPKSSLLQMSQISGSKQNIEEWTPLKGSSKEAYGRAVTVPKKGGLDDSSDFFPLILQEIEKVNKFFIGKLAQLRIKLNQITSKRQNVYFSHHTSGESELTLLRDIYVELAALRSYCDLNQTGCSRKMLILSQVVLLE